ncbi:hypothetical protein, partial [Escherichia coli]|uniref:hypothetical protein n=1 Tax=Escherichia coli TaxID=562 RepID=UPI0015E5FD85
NRANISGGRPQWDDWFDRISRFPEGAQVYFPEQAATVSAIEAVACEIVVERDKLPVMRDAAMIEKIGQLARASATSELPLGERIASSLC